MLSSGCKKKDTTPTSTTPPPPSPVIVDTTTYVTRLEEDYVTSNPVQTRRNRDYTFYYDNNKRLTKVGIKNYGQVLFDTAACLLFYSGNNKKPDMIITPNNRGSSYTTVFYDTTYFKYNQSNQLVSDSSLEYIPTVNFAYVKKPFKRYYFYPDNTHTLVDWYGSSSATGPTEIIRRDTLQHTTDNKITILVTQYYSGNIRANYAITETLTYTNFLNPLSMLNISGTFFSLIYTPVNKEVLGNQYHKAVYNSNILPYYLDFYSSRIPSKFYLGGFTSGGFLISAQYDLFDILITPWQQKPWYPSQISVGASTALGDRFVYRYFY